MRSTETVVTTTTLYAVKPSDIDSSGLRLWHAFRNHAAAYVVRFCQKQGSWAPFTSDDLNAFYREAHDDSAPFSAGFQRLVVAERQWIVKNGERYHVTQAFVARCHEYAEAGGTVRNG